MSSDELRKSLANNGPSDLWPGALPVPVPDDFGVMLYTGGVSGTETDHAATPLPGHWANRELGLLVTGGTVHVAFSKLSTAEVDRSVPATANGVAAKVGLPIAAGVEKRIRVPRIGPGETLYFVREADTLGATVRVRVLD